MTILLCSQSAALRARIQTDETTTPIMRAITHTRSAMSAEAEMRIKYANICMLVRKNVKSLGQRASYEGKDYQSLNGNSVSSLHTNGEEVLT
jgi:hypothetical protein